MAAFLSGARGTLRRTYYLADFMGSGEDMEIVRDVSPTGIGAFLVEQGTITEYFEDALTAEDEKMLSATRGDSTGQQVWEALSVVCALRLWAEKWAQRRTHLRVTGDSVSALTMVVKMNAKGGGHGPLGSRTRLGRCRSSV